MDARRASSPPTDLALLGLRAEMALDGHGRLAATFGVTIVLSGEGQVLFVGSDVPDTLAQALVNAVGTSLPAPAPDGEPPALGACRTILAPAGVPLSLQSGPCYLIEPDALFETPTHIVRSDTPLIARPHLVNPGNWEREEWDELLEGVLGPWAMAVAEGEVVSICHTPGPMTERAAECGVWTHPDFRGRGLAAAVTATWADILRPGGRRLFYSTDAGNRSSQRVAARLGLRLIGWTWSLTSAGRERGSQRHPLSRRSA